MRPGVDLGEPSGKSVNIPGDGGGVKTATMLAACLHLLAGLGRVDQVIVDGIKGQARRVGSIGDFIREQRELAQFSMRQLASLAGVSNPYLSQIERGLRKPSAEILQQIAKGLQISAEQLYVRAGILETRVGDPATIASILADPGLGERQKHLLIEIYESLRRDNVDMAVPAAAAGHDPLLRPPTARSEE